MQEDEPPDFLSEICLERNEGADRGILVGPDKTRPICLVDGPNLFAMLQKHGHRYRIDLEEVRRLHKSACSAGTSVGVTVQSGQVYRSRRRQ
jgi:hypothetical protein